MGKDEKMIIYQVFTRLFGNNHNHCINNGNITENGCGKMADFTAKALNEIKKLGATHIWYTGIDAVIMIVTKQARKHPYLVYRYHRACHANGLSPLQYTSRSSGYC